MTIRKATNDDLPYVLQLIHEFAAFQRSTDKVTMTLEQMKQDKELFNCLVAEEYGIVIGFATYFFAYYSWSGKALYLDDLYVKETHRKKGYGRDLLSAVIGIAAESNCKKMRWQVSKWNENAIAFYKSLGAEIDEVEINCSLLVEV